MLYTKKGDNGTTKLFDCQEGQRVSKGALVFEALGTLDELNCSIGYAKTLAHTTEDVAYIGGAKISYPEILEIFQQNLFSVQGELAGGEVRIAMKHVAFLERVIDEIDTLLPPIRSFIIPGGGTCGAYLDVTRTIARRAERLIVMVRDRGERAIQDESIQFLNRLSSALYAMARFANYQEGYSEQKPLYN